MKNRTKFTVSFASALLAVALFITPAQAEDTQNCQAVYGGQVCASSTPEIVATAGEAEILYTLSGALYGTGLFSFILAKNADKFVPKL